MGRRTVVTFAPERHTFKTPVVDAQRRGTKPRSKVSTYKTAAAEALIAAAKMNTQVDKANFRKSNVEEEEATEGPAATAEVPWYNQLTKKVLDHVERISRPSGHCNQPTNPFTMKSDEVLTKEHVIRVWVGSLTTEPPACSPTLESSQPIDSGGDSSPLGYSGEVSRLERLRRKLAQQERWQVRSSIFYQLIGPYLQILSIVCLFGLNLR